MLKSFATAAALAGAVFGCASAQASFLVPVVPVPGSIATTAMDINNNNELVGFYTTSDGITHVFTGTIGGQYTTFDFPGGNSLAYSIDDDGVITGLSEVPTEDCPLFGCQYLRNPGGAIVPITKRGTVLDGLPETMTKQQKSVGEYWVLDENDHLFEYGYYGKGARYRSDLVLPVDTTRTRPRGYNKHGVVVGYYRDASTQLYPGFILKKDVVTTVQYPGPNAFYTYLEGINDKGAILGGWANQDGTIGASFFYDPDTDAYKPIPVPGSAWSLARGLNDAGVATVGSDVGSFIYCPRMSACPNAKGAIEIADKWIAAPSLYRHWAVCHRHCMGPVGQSTMRSNAFDAASVQDAVGRDPTARSEIDLELRR